MQVQHYKDSNGKLYGFAADGSQDHLKPAGLIAISDAEAHSQGIVNYQAQIEAEKANMDYVRQRLHSYPPMSDFVDAWVKNDQAALEEYRQACLAVKAQYPKPPGF